VAAAALATVSLPKRRLELRGHLAAGDVVLVKASREARLDEVAAALA
jgi:UDP-N-acetylmuramyl pentapeptide synthase